MLAPILPGNLMGDASTYYTEELLVLPGIVYNSTTNIEVWFERGYGSDTVNTCYPSLGSGVCRNNFPYNTGSGAWNIGVYPYQGSDSAFWWYNSASPTSTVLYESNLYASHEDFGPAPGGTTNYSFNGDDSFAKFNAPVNSSGFVAIPTTVNNSGSWNGAQKVLPLQTPNSMESYPTIRAALAPSTEQQWAGDWHFIQGGGGANGGGTATLLFSGVTFTPITAGGRTHVWQISGLTETINPKTNPLEAWAGRYVYQDRSGPTANAFTDATPGYCVAYAINECITGAAAGNIYFSDSMAVISSEGACYTNHMEANLPCLLNASPVGGWILQQDISQNNTGGYLMRRLTQAFMNPGRVQPFSSWRPTPDAKWGMIVNNWADGFAPLMWFAKLSPWPGYDSVRRDNFLQVPVQIGPGAALAEVRWYYGENGGYCTSRAETCATASSPTNTNPFNFITADGHSGTSCASGCTINVPLLAGRVAFAQVYRSADGGTTWVGQGLQSIGIQ
jgi:hypothetical protein